MAAAVEPLAAPAAIGPPAAPAAIGPPAAGPPPPGHDVALVGRAGEVRRLPRDRA
jgi:hypothetical protein